MTATVTVHFLGQTPTTELEEALASNDLNVENIGHVPTFHGGNARKCIVVTLSKNLRSTIYGWQVNTNYNGLDHNTIEFSVKQEQVNIPKVWEWHKANWDKFCENMKKVSYVIPSTITNDACEGTFYETLFSTIQKSIPQNFCFISFLVDYFSPESAENNIYIYIYIYMYM